MTDIDDLIGRLGKPSDTAFYDTERREAAAALRAQRAEIARLNADIGRRAQSELATYSDTSALALQYLERAERAEAERDLAQAEASSATEAATVLLTALGWKSGGLAAAAIQIVAKRDAAMKDAELLRHFRSITMKAINEHHITNSGNVDWIGKLIVHDSIIDAAIAKGKG